MPEAIGRPRTQVHTFALNEHSVIDCLISAYLGLSRNSSEVEIACFLLSVLVYF